MADTNIEDRRFWGDIATYGCFLSVLAIVVPSISSVTERSQENSVLLGICLATLVVNFFVALWMFSQPHGMQDNGWKSFIFNLTGILSLYFAFSMILPGWLTWPGFGTICTTMACIEGYNKMQSIYNRACEKIAFAVSYVIAKFSLLFAAATATITTTGVVVPSATTTDVVVASATTTDVVTAAAATSDVVTIDV